MTLDGIAVVFSPSVMGLDARIRGRLLDRILRMDIPEGTAIFAGFAVEWRVHEFAGRTVLDIYMED